MVACHDGGAAEGERLAVDLSAPDDPDLFVGGDQCQRLIERAGRLDALARERAVAREHDVATVLERTSARKALERPATEQDRVSRGAGNEVAHVGLVAHDHVAIEANAPIVARGHNGKQVRERLAL